MKQTTDGLVVVLGKLVFSGLVLALALTPFWLWLGLKSLIGPVGFWQNFLVVGLGVNFLWAIQFVLIVVFLVALVALWEI